MTTFRDVFDQAVGMQRAGKSVSEIRHHITSQALMIGGNLGYTETTPGISGPFSIRLPITGDVIEFDGKTLRFKPGVQ
ncbi:hypothetical protein ACVW1C_000071 [Bradyrhizobium sp. USDA 4011]